MASYNMQGLAQTDHFLYDFALSYLPKMPLSTHYGTLELLELNVAVNICSGFVGLVLEIFTFADHIAFVCSYVEPLLDKTWVENFMDQFQQNIIELTSD
ncbi:MAG: hypothetical protein HWD59_01630 [Coxiellaceae bacterium]|nr:MAG: hypothetical protein HWD59_01630 [Coxiellaceae bacterium]